MILKIFIWLLDLDKECSVDVSMYVIVIDTFGGEVMKGRNKISELYTLLR